MIQPYSLGTSVTRIDGGNIATGTINAQNAVISGSITTALLNVTDINSSGSLTVSGAQITINGSTTFSSGYNPKTVGDNLATLQSDLNNDDVVTPVEKTAIKPVYDAIIAEQTGLVNQANAFSIVTERDTYTGYITTLTTQIGSMFSVMNTNTVLAGGQGAVLRTNFQNVQTSRQALVNKLAAQAKSLAEGTAATALSNFSNTMNDDDVVTPVEKTGLKPIYDAIIAEQTNLVNQANAFSIVTERDTYTGYITTLTNQINGVTLFTTMNINTTLSAGQGAVLRTNFQNVLSSKSALLTKISNQANTLAVSTASADATSKADAAKLLTQQLASQMVKPTWFYDFAGASLPAPWSVLQQFTASSSDGGTSTTLTSTGTDPIIHATGISIDPLQSYALAARIKLVSGSWEATCYYSNGGHGYSGSYCKTLAGTIPTGEWVTVVWDMRTLSAGGADYTAGGNVTGLRLDLTGTNGGVVVIDWIAIGIFGAVSASDVSTATTNAVNSVKTLYGYNSDQTKIDGGKIYTGTVALNSLGFYPVTTASASGTLESKVIASINATENNGLTIQSSRINIDGNCVFTAGYNPTTKADGTATTNALAGKIANGSAAADVNANSTQIQGGKIIITGASGIVGAINSANGGSNTTTIDGGSITTNSISASHIKAGSITAAKMSLIASSLVSDANFEGGTANWNGWYSTYTGSDRIGSAAARFNARDCVSTAAISVRAGEKYFCSIVAHPDSGSGGGGVGIVCIEYDSVGTVTAAYTVATATTNAWNTITGIATMSPTTVSARFGPWVGYSGFVNGPYGPPIFCNFSVRKMNDASLIVDGAITANKLNVSDINSAGTLTVTGAQININGSTTFSSGYNPATKADATATTNALSGKIGNGGAATDVNNYTTTINGGKITTYSLSADKIGVGELVSTGPAYVQDGSGNATVGFKLGNQPGDTNPRGAKFASGVSNSAYGIRIGGSDFSDYWWRLVQAIDGNIANGVVVMRGNIDNTVLGGAPNINCFDIYDYGWVQDAGAYNWCQFEWRLQPTALSDNLDAMRMARVKMFPLQGGASPIRTFYIPLVDRLYANITSSNAANAAWGTHMYGSRFSASQGTYWASGDPYYFCGHLLISIANAYGWSAEYWFHSNALYQTWYTRNLTPPAGAPSGGGGGGGGGTGGTCPAPWVKITLANGMIVDAGDLYNGAKVLGANDLTLEPMVGTISNYETLWSKRIEIVLEDGRDIVFSLNHRLYVLDKGWVEVQKLVPGDLLMSQTPARVKTLNAYPDGTVISFTVDGCHTYLTNDVLSHNMKLLTL